MSIPFPLACGARGKAPVLSQDQGHTHLEKVGRGAAASTLPVDWEGKRDAATSCYLPTPHTSFCASSPNRGLLGLGKR